MFEDSCQIMTVMPHPALFAKAWLSEAITFITMEIIYYFKNTDIEHSFAVILLYFFSRSFHPKALS